MVLKLLLSFAADPSVLRYDQVVVDGLSRLSEISHNNRRNRIVLDELGVNAILLKRLPQVLSKTTGNPMLHAVVLDLLVQQAQFKMSRDDLQSFIDFFKTNPPSSEDDNRFKVLLKALDDIVSANMRLLEPRSHLSFPVVATHGDDVTGQEGARQATRIRRNKSIFEIVSREELKNCF